MRYHVKARLKPGRARALETAIENGTLGRGSVAGGEYLRNMRATRVTDAVVEWIEVCYCDTPLEEERPYWAAYFDLLSVTDAHDPRACKHRSGINPWTCGVCRCTWKLERELETRGEAFLETLPNLT
jgi:hypothetical protein